MHDLVDDPAYAHIQTDLIAMLKAKQKEPGDFMDIEHTQGLQQLRRVTLAQIAIKTGQLHFRLRTHEHNIRTAFLFLLLLVATGATFSVAPINQLNITLTDSSAATVRDGR